MNYDRVYRLKAQWPERFVGINGGIATLDEAEPHLGFVDGVMLGRAAYHDPALLGEVDRRVFGDAAPTPDPVDVVVRYRPYVAAQLARGVRLHHLTRHMLGLFHGRPGARRWRQVLTLRSTARHAGLEVIDEALQAVAPGRVRVDA